jgi:hypothetical protein
MPTLPRSVRAARTCLLSCLMLTAPIFALKVAAQAPPAPVLIGPNGNTTNPTPVYTWNVAAGATSYYLEVSNGTTYVYQGGIPADQICSGATCAASPHSPPGSPSPSVPTPGM